MNMKQMDARKRTKRLLACLLALMLAAGTISAAMADDAARTTIRRGSSGEDVTYTQQFLKDKGYYDGPITGHMGTNTTQALMAYQRDQGLTADGIAGKKTWSTISSAQTAPTPTPVQTNAGGNTQGNATPAPVATATPLPTLASNALGTATLRYGMRSATVSALQTRLKELGYFSHSVTGYFGTATRTAVQAFQRDNGLTADGLVGSATRARLYAATAPVHSSAAQQTPAPSATAQPLAYGALGVSTLKKGVTSDAVAALQRQLKTLGYYSGTVTGSFGTLTKQAVMDFQRANGLSADGVVGSATRNRLYGVSAGMSNTSGQTSTAAPATPTYAPALDNLGTVTMRLDDQNEYVRALQRKLAALGYYDGPITGHYGRKTKQAVMDFQKANGISRDGVAGGTTLQKINAAATPTPVPTPTPVATPTPTPTPTSTIEPEKMPETSVPDASTGEAQPQS